MLLSRFRNISIVTTILIVGMMVSGMSDFEEGKDIELLFHKQMKELISSIDSLEVGVTAHHSVNSLKTAFRESRGAYKRASVLLDYFFPYQFKLINGPDVKKADEENPDVVVKPEGFQVIERMLCGNVSDSFYISLSAEIKALKRVLIAVQAQEQSAHKFKDALVFDALRSADIRLMSQGITGFDSPLMLNSINEASSTLYGINEILTVFQPEIKPEKFDSCQLLLKEAIKYCSTQNHFNSFNRLHFIKSFADPLYGFISTIAAEQKFILADERRSINQFSKSIFSKDFFDINYFSPNDRYRVTQKRKFLGSLLFADSILSPVSKRSCSSCHHPENAFADGLRYPPDVNGGRKLKRNTPTLLNAALQTRYFYDSRTETLENQLNSVVHNIDEMNGSLKSSIPRLVSNKKYNLLFKEAYPSDAQPITEYNIANAISSYVRSLVDLNSSFDKFMRDETGDYPASAVNGFNLFMGKAKCGTCHYLPLFNGLVPPRFFETESEVIGVPGESTRQPKPDDDPGKFGFTRALTDKQAFKTPTLRNVGLTAPYMHNGVFNTLEQVPDFYNKGGGSGTGTAPVNETLPSGELHLTRKEKRNIISFLHTLSGSNQVVYTQGRP